MQPHPEWNLRVITIWVPVLESDTEATARRGPPEMPDPRVTHCFDRGAVTSRWYLRHVVEGWPDLAERPVFRKGMIWDAFFLYGPEVTTDELRSGCLAAGATILRDRPTLLEGLGRLFPGG